MKLVSCPCCSIPFKTARDAKHIVLKADLPEPPKGAFTVTDDLALYRLLIPSLKIAITRAGNDDNRAMLEDILYAASRATLFDCRKLPLGFVEDTGDATIDEWQATNELVSLPDDNCYFEFSPITEGTHGLAVLAWTDDGSLVGKAEKHGEELLEFPAAPVFFWGAVLGFDQPDKLEPYLEPSAGVFHNLNTGDDSDLAPDFHAVINPDGQFGNSANGYAQFLLAGVLTLLNEGLVLESITQDPKPWLNRKRLLKHKPRISNDIHWLTVNVPKVRRLAERHGPITHDSPVLHWRRGHKRTLPGDKSTWVRKHLVGDPEKGYLPPKGYRLKYRTPNPLAMPTSNLGEALLR